MADEGSLWFYETVTPALHQRVQVASILYRGRSAYQSIEVLELVEFGRALVLDGKTQSTEGDEFIYHEALVHPALLAHPSPHRAFIAGGGEGATLREVLRHQTVEQAVMVDIDPQVVEACRRFLPRHHQGAFDDPRTRLIFADAKHYLAGDPQRYDAIFLDLTDPLEGGPSQRLFTREFFGLVKDRLSPGGVMVVQAGPAMVNAHQGFSTVHRTVATVFPLVVPYCAAVPSFGGQWGFVLGSLGPDPRALPLQEVERRLRERVRGELRFYDGEAHPGLFALPRFLRRALAAETRIASEASPLSIS